jgi:hypothetical protein
MDGLSDDIIFMKCFGKFRNLITLFLNCNFFCNTVYSPISGGNDGERVQT